LLQLAVCHAAADVFRTVFARLRDHLARPSQPARLQAWIVTTAKREALRSRQLGQRTVSMTRPEDERGVALEGSLPDNSPLADDALDRLQQLDQLRAGLWTGWTRSAAIGCCCSVTMANGRPTTKWHAGSRCRSAVSDRHTRVAWPTCVNSSRRRRRMSDRKYLPTGTPLCEP
jgi:hypothetical protein